jgi:hypothetical protein
MEVERGMVGAAAMRAMDGGSNDAGHVRAATEKFITDAMNSTRSREGDWPIG